jgi:transglutaminase-like putative cysteine protease
MNRRNFLQTGVGAAVAAALPRFADSAPDSPQSALMEPGHFKPSPQAWRVFDVVTRIELLTGSGKSRVWVPLPSVNEDAWMRPMGNRWSGNAETMRPVTEPHYGTQMLFAEWSDKQTAPVLEVPVLEVSSRFATRDRRTDWNVRGDHRLSDAERRLYTEATGLIPTDGIVHRTASAAIGDARSDVDKARAIYEWIVDNTARNPKTRGCGLGDIGTMLETGDLSGKCADINTLFVGMCRAVGIPARDVYGVRVADSRFGYRSLGKSGDITKAQHCRAEVFLEAYGWVPADPADVRKVVLEEQAGLTLAHPLVTPVREQLFGAWETNWLAYNFGHDIELPFSNGPVIPFIMYPQGETADGRLDSLAPEQFRYRLTSAEITA